MCSSDLFGSLCLPPLFLFAMMAISEITGRILPKAEQKSSVLSGILILMLALPGGLRTYNEGIPRMSHIDGAMTEILASTKNNPDSNCIMYVGDFKQAFTQSLRRLDQDRRYHLLPIESQQVTGPDQCETIVIEGLAIKEQSDAIKSALFAQDYVLTESFF